MAAIILGNSSVVNTGTSITTLPPKEPVSILNIGSGSSSDTWKVSSGNKLLPSDLLKRVGLGYVTSGSTSNKILMYDDSNREIKSISGSAYSESTHTHAFNALTSKPTTLSGYGINDAQPLDPDLTSIAGLGFSSESFLKKTGTNTWELDTKTYEEALGNPPVDDYVLSSKTNGTRSWVAPITGGGGGGVSDHGLLTGLADDDHPQYAPKISPTFTGTVTIPLGFKLSATTVNTTAAQLNYLSSATGTTGTTSSNLVFSASPTFTGTVSVPSPFNLGGVSMITSAAKLNYLSSITGTTGSTSSFIVFSSAPTISSPILVTPFIGVATGTSLHCSGDIVAYSS